MLPRSISKLSTNLAERSGMIVREIMPLALQSREWPLSPDGEESCGR
jgi:hypothetical protein